MLAYSVRCSSFFFFFCWCHRWCQKHGWKFGRRKKKQIIRQAVYVSDYCRWCWASITLSRERGRKSTHTRASTGLSRKVHGHNMRVCTTHTSHIQKKRRNEPNDFAAECTERKIRVRHLTARRNNCLFQRLAYLTNLHTHTTNTVNRRCTQIH